MIQKYKAWWRDEKKMIDVFTMVWFKYGLYIQGTEFSDSLVAGIDCDLMRSTGRKDKNGVEWYDMEIIERAGIKYQVIWDEMKLRFSAIHEDGGERSEIFDNGSPIDHLIKIGFVSIGNRFANPELLNSDDMEGGR